MGIKLGSVVEVISSTCDVRKGRYTITNTDPSDLKIPFLGEHQEGDEQVWFTARGEVFGFLEETTTVIVSE